MPRPARLVLPGLPHHVTQRGNGRQRIFFAQGDYALYRDLLRHYCRKSRTAVWAWCLMPNHVHLILVPAHEDGLRATLAPAHTRYAVEVNRRHGRCGHLWQARFASVAMDEAHLHACLRYVELNPVRAGLVERPEAWRWSSARAHLGSRDDGVTTLAPVGERYPDFANFLSEETDAEAIARLRSAETIGRPLGSRKFLETLERKTRRVLSPAKRGPKPRSED